MSSQSNVEVVPETALRPEDAAVTNVSTNTLAANLAPPVEDAAASAPELSITTGEQSAVATPAAAPNAVPGSSDGDASDHSSVMTVIEHLDELRSRIIRCLIYIAASFVVALFVTNKIIIWLKAPAGPIQFIVLSLEEPVFVFIKVAFYTGLALASPMVLFELARFIAPGLTRKERQILTPIVVGSPLLFLCGAAFAYFGLLPPMLKFFNSFSQGVAPINQRLDFYISLVSSILLYMGLCFQLPIILFALSFAGIVSSKFLISIWRYALVGCTLIAAVVTPDPTAMSMLMVMGALMTLYFLSVLVMKLFGR